MTRQERHHNARQGRRKRNLSERNANDGIYQTQCTQKGPARTSGWTPSERGWQKRIKGLSEIQLTSETNAEPSSSLARDETTTALFCHENSAGPHNTGYIPTQSETSLSPRMLSYTQGEFALHLGHQTRSNNPYTRREKERKEQIAGHTTTTPGHT